MKLPLLLSAASEQLSGQESLGDRQLASLVGPVGVAVLLGAAGIWLMIVGRGRRTFFFGSAAALAGLIVATRQLPPPAGTLMTIGFWLPAGLTIVAAVATISSKNPVYSAVWFAVTLLGTAGLLLLQGAQFIGMATVVVYAGAIVVTFLFVLMLAQPGGQARCDRISWGRFPVALASVAGVALIGAVVTGASNLGSDEQQELNERVLAVLPDFADEQGRRLIEDNEFRGATVLPLQDGVKSSKFKLTLGIRNRESILSRSDELRRRIAAEVLNVEPSSIRLELVFVDVMDRHHMARLGGRLFSQYLVAVEVAGTLLMVALVGAVAIVIQGHGAAGERDAKDE